MSGGASNPLAVAAVEQRSQPPRTMRTLSRLTLAAVALAASPLLLFAQGQRRTLPGDDVAIYNLAGEMRVEAGTGNEVVVEVTTAGPDAGQLKIESGELRGRSTLRVIYPGRRVIYREMEGSSTTLSVREDGTFGGDHSGWGDRVRISDGGSGIEAHANLRVLVPAGRRVWLNLAAGRVSITNVNARLVVDVASASVAARGVRGALSVDAGSGDVEVAEMNGDLEVDTGSGSVRVTGVKGTRHNIDTGSGGVTATGIEGERLIVDVGSGDIHVRDVRASTIRLDSGSGSVDAELAGTVRDLVIDTGSGDVTLRLPKTFGADVEIDTGSGSIRTGFPIVTQEFKRDALRGRIGDGSARVRIDTGSGSVQLLQL
jgi:lia operon protein LiaG